LVKIRWYWQIPIWILVILGIIMFIPFKTGETNMLGYQSLSSLTPIPSIILWIIAIIVYGIAKKRTKTYKLT
jgi:hypothetical protein